MWSRRFKLGEFRYMTRVNIEDGVVIISQSERRDNPKMDYRSVVLLHLEDFKKMAEAVTGANDG